MYKLLMFKLKDLPSEEISSVKEVTTCDRLRTNYSNCFHHIIGQEI